ncbi:GNAT family N-acetyltransferase [Corynebacterium sp. HMSC034A01]|uniref:GNAT family N-acetyltransferase n=1 Tax=Corynebacterium sp. HMSC034A01 TaxID=1739295 RepID=UPI0008A8E4F8|nr:GNAT family N-acetyltransferase [Corynebacterium sp. HMSC034A01]OHR24106.1 hypothetical protein HMPREF2791_04970 [Corynebacterium sp. HMSC034A01]
MAADRVLQPPRQLVKSDDRASFRCGTASLDLWFHRYALQNQRVKNCAVYVSTWNERVAGYYAICTGGLEKEAAPGNFAKGRPDPIPVIILARLAVDVNAQGKGVGRALLRDALARCFTAAAAVGAAAVVVHALDQQAKDFYLRHADFHEIPGEPLHLLLPMKGIAQIVAP